MSDGRRDLPSGAMASPTPELSRRALFGLGLARLRERGDDRPVADAAAALDDVRARWARDAAMPSPLWRPVAGRVVETAAVAAGERVLAHGGCAVHAAAAGADVTMLEGDPSTTAFEDGAFDVVLSAFAPQVTPTALDALAELGRLVAPGGRLVLAVWSGGAVARLLRTLHRLEPLPGGRPSAAHWGRDERLRQDLWRFVAEPEFEDFAHELVFPSAHAALAALLEALPAAAGVDSPADRAALGADLAPYLHDSADGVVVPVPCLVATAVKPER